MLIVTMVMLVAAIFSIPSSVSAVKYSYLLLGCIPFVACPYTVKMSHFTACKPVTNVLHYCSLAGVQVE